MSEINTLDDREIEQVNGGFLPQLLAAYAVANIGYQFYKGMNDGAAGVHEESQ